MRVAVVHYWLVGMRGGEKVLEAILDLFPQADIFTHVYAPAAVSPAIRRRTVRTSFIQKLPFAVRAYQTYLPLMPLALEQLDLRGYDLVISSESGPAKGVLTGADALHLCYCHTPMRYLWDYYQEYLEEAGPAARLALRLYGPRLRMWDALSSLRVDFFAANSRNVARRVAKHYRRRAEVIHPPVAVDFFAPAGGVYPETEDYYLYAGQLTAYKRADLAVQACARLNKKLLVIGAGPERKRLEAMAGPGAIFLGRQDGETLRRHMQRCKALLFPGEEDFGIVPVEALAAGRPVIALGRGGALETVRPGHTGLLFHEPTAEALGAAVEAFERGGQDFDPAALTKEAEAYAPERFRSAFSRFVEQSLARGPGGEIAAGPPREAPA